MLRPTELSGTVRQSRELPDRVKRHHRIVGAGLDREVSAGQRGLELIAVELRHVDQRRRPLGRKPVSIRSVLQEEPRPEAERDGQPGRREAERRAAVRALDRQVLTQDRAPCRRRTSAPRRRSRAGASRSGRRGSWRDSRTRRNSYAPAGAWRSRPDGGRKTARGARPAPERRASPRARKRARADARQRSAGADEESPTRRPGSRSGERAAHFASTSVLFSSSTK